jgi:two-component system, LytTR family, sensor kinase
MDLPQPIRKQFLVAAYSSVAISALTVTPVFILSQISGQNYFLALGFGALLVFFGWAANIGIYALVGGEGRRRGQLWRYLLSYIFCLLATFGLFHGHMIPRGGGRSESLSSGFHFHLIVFLAVDTVILILQDLIITRERNAAIELENSRLKLSQAEALNLQLKQQIQPHFLFNSLSALKALIRTSPQLAEEYLIRLSDFLRYAVSSHGHVVEVGREVELCMEYLEMQRIRFGEALQYDINVPASIRESYDIPVFSLQLLIENAIKHNILTMERPLLIRVFHEKGSVTVANNLQKKPAAGSDSPGMGLANLRERYMSLTGDEIVIREETDQYSVSIKLLVHEDRDH